VIKKNVKLKITYLTDYEKKKKKKNQPTLVSTNVGWFLDFLEPLVLGF
jgi:hypothetical protein